MKVLAETWRGPLLILVGVVAILVSGLMANGGTRTAHAGLQDCAQFSNTGVLEFCLSLDPETDSNSVGDDHTVTATLSLTEDGVPVAADLSGVPVTIFVFHGPNAIQVTLGATDGAGQFVFPYTGTGPAGKDAIGAVACLALEETNDEGSVEIASEHSCEEELEVGLFSDIVGFCTAPPIPGRPTPAPSDCLSFGLVQLQVCDGTELLLCDTATNDWVAPAATATATPTPAPTVLAATATPTPAPTATPTPTVLAVALPATGGAPSDGGSDGILAWLAAICGAIAGMSVGGLWLARRAGRVR